MKSYVGEERNIRKKIIVRKKPRKGERKGKKDRQT
jgi:hypothetical protein